MVSDQTGKPIPAGGVLHKICTAGKDAGNFLLTEISGGCKSDKNDLNSPES
jgi:hypothetical protein